MIPRVAKGSGVGKSFTGAMAYLMHDKADHGALRETSDRVMWTETRNLAVDDPELAARVMAAVALDSDRLKREFHYEQQAAGNPNFQSEYKSSKPSFNHVFHYSLAWAPTEEYGWDRDTQAKAVNESLRRLGADHLQTVIVSHGDEKYPHVHVIVNRINPETGRAEAVESHAKAKLRDWASDYERAHEVHCTEREHRRMLREQGLAYQHEPKKTRAQRDAEAPYRESIQVAPEHAKAISERQRELDKSLASKTGEMRKRHSEEWEKLSKDHAWRKSLINDAADGNRGHAGLKIAEEYEPAWKTLQADQRTARAAFEEREQTLHGKIGNVRDALGSIWKARNDDELESGLIKSGFKVLASEGARREALRKEQDAAQRALAKEEKSALKSAHEVIETERKQQIDANYQFYTTQRSDLELCHAADQAANKAEWKQRGQDRAEAWQNFNASVRMEHEFEQAAGKDVSIDVTRSEGGVTPSFKDAQNDTTPEINQDDSNEITNPKDDYDREPD